MRRQSSDWKMSDAFSRPIFSREEIYDINMCVQNLLVSSKYSRVCLHIYENTFRRNDQEMQDK
jgi:hypothetical protein